MCLERRDSFQTDVAGSWVFHIISLVNADRVQDADYVLQEDINLRDVLDDTAVEKPDVCHHVDKHP